MELDVSKLYFYEDTINETMGAFIDMNTFNKNISAFKKRGRVFLNSSERDILIVPFKYDGIDKLEKSGYEEL